MSQDSPSNSVIIDANLVHSSEIESENKANESLNHPEEEDYQDYGSVNYWEMRYSICSEAYDWYAKWPAILKELKPIFSSDDLVLNIGCGNSEMPAEMQETTFPVVVNIDYSQAVINQMKEKYRNNPDLIWFVMDCTQLTFEDDFFDIVFDKGTFDAILCGENGYNDICSSMSEIFRVLKEGGLFIEITYGKPDNRIALFNSIDIDFTIYDPIEMPNSEDSSTEYIYIFQKLPNT